MSWPRIILAIVAISLYLFRLMYFINIVPKLHSHSKLKLKANHVYKNMIWKTSMSELQGLSSDIMKVSGIQVTRVGVVLEIIAITLADIPGRLFQ